MNDDTPPNVFQLISNGTGDNPADALPSDEYVIVTHDGEEFFATGFLLFTSHHVAVMRDTGTGAKPVMVVPLSNVKMAEIVEDDDEEDTIP